MSEKKFIKTWYLVNLIPPSSVNTYILTLTALNFGNIIGLFQFVDGGKKYDLLPWGADIYPWGKQEYSVCLFTEKTRGVKVTPMSPLGGASNNRCTVRITSRDPPIEISARIIHEMLHVMGVDSDQLDGKDKQRFSEYLRRTRSKYADYYIYPQKYWSNWSGLGQQLLLEYYRYLLRTDLGVKC